MDSEFALLIAFVLSIPVVALVSLILTLVQRGRVRRLEATVAELSARLETLGRSPDAAPSLAASPEAATDQEPAEAPPIETPAAQPAAWPSEQPQREDAPEWGEIPAPSAPETTAHNPAAR